jgi:hypothetical protein
MLDHTLRGRVRVRAVDRSGATRLQVVKSNTIVDAGRVLVGRRLIGDPAAGPISHLAVGSSATAASTGNTALGAEIGSIARASIKAEPLPSGIGLRVSAQLTSPTSQSISEAGLFNAAEHGVGVMYNRVTFPSPIPIGPDLDLAFEWDITF